MSIHVEKIADVRDLIGKGIFRLIDNPSINIMYHCNVDVEYCGTVKTATIYHDPKEPPIIPDTESAVNNDLKDGDIIFEFNDKPDLMIFNSHDFSLNWFIDESKAKFMKLAMRGI